MSSVAGVAPIPAWLGDAQGEPVTILGFAAYSEAFRGDVVGPIIARQDGSLVIVDLDAVRIASPGELRRGARVAWSASSDFERRADGSIWVDGKRVDAGG